MTNTCKDLDESLTAHSGLQAALCAFVDSNVVDMPLLSIDRSDHPMDKCLER